MNNTKKDIFIILIIALFLLLIGVSYAFFTATITGRETTSTIVLSGGQMLIHYDNNSGEIIAENIYPREETWVTKSFTVTGTNTTDLKMKYKVGLDISSNTFPDGYLTYSLENTQADSGTPLPDKENKPIYGTGSLWFGEGLFVTGSNQVHAYTLNIYFKDTGLNQNDAQGASFAAKVAIVDNGTGELGKNITIDLGNQYTYTINHDPCIELFENQWNGGEELSDPNAIAMAEGLCTTGEFTDEYDTYTLEEALRNINITEEEAETEGIITITGSVPRTEPYAGFEYTDGPYIYRYKQAADNYRGEQNWDNFEEDGWGVVLTDSFNGTNLHANDDLVPASYINGKPIMYMNYMFSMCGNSQGICDYLNRIDFSQFDTSHVVSMERMFYSSVADSLDLSDFDTTNLENTVAMFVSADISSINLSNFIIKEPSTMFTNSTVEKIKFTNDKF